MYNVPYRLATTETTHRTPYQCLMPMLTSSAHVYVAKLWPMIRSWDASFKEDSAVLPGRASCWNSRSSSWMMVLTLIRTLSGSSLYFCCLMLWSSAVLKYLGEGLRVRVRVRVRDRV